MLYAFSRKLENTIKSLIGDIDKPARDDAEDFCEHLKLEYVSTHRRALSTDEDAIPNAQVLQGMMNKVFGKRAAKRGLTEYFDALESQL